MPTEHPLTLQQLGDELGVSRERVRQLEKRVHGKLRELLAASLGPQAIEGSLSCRSASPRTFVGGVLALVEQQKA